MSSYLLAERVTEENFTEEGYLGANPDIFHAVKIGAFTSGRAHYDMYGKNEARCVRVYGSIILDAKRTKLERIKPLLRQDMPFTLRQDHLFDFLSDNLKAMYSIIDTYAVSNNSYDGTVMDVIELNKDKLVLDCGAGSRQVYIDNVVNLEIVDYDTTDVLGVGEELPFVDNAFDAVLSLSVLEHVKNPFRCAQEIARVLKPGGQLVCSVPFLQPFHGYPNHYYNMTHKGLENLFDDYLAIDKIDVYEGTLPVWSLTWILRSWADGLMGKTKDDFLQMKVADLIASGEQYVKQPFVTELSMEKNLELASAIILIAHKK
ncbi:MAG: methyltransferase domain-containing protein [Bacteroidota bacterium]